MAVDRWDLARAGGGGKGDGWREILACGYVPFDVRPAPRAGETFDAWVSRRSLGDVAMVESAHGCGRGRRGRAEIAGPTGELLGVSVLRRGRLALTLGEDWVVLSAGQALVWDGRLAGGFEALEPIEKCTLLVSRERLRGVAPRYEAMVGRVLPADSPRVRLLGGFLDTVSTMGALDEGASAAAGEAAMDLARGVIGAGPAEGEAGFHLALLTQAQRYVADHLGLCSLSPETVARAHAVSLRTMQRVFEEAGESLSAHIRRRRLERCYEELAVGQGPVADVALRWGFGNPAHFSRVFRQAFDVSPREVQAAGRLRSVAAGQDRDAYGQVRRVAAT